jgi:hypothetical protein
MLVHARWTTQIRTDTVGDLRHAGDVCCCGACGTPFGITTNRRWLSLGKSIGRYTGPWPPPADVVADAEPVVALFGFLTYHCVDVRGNGHFTKLRAPRRPSGRPAYSPLRAAPNLAADPRFADVIVNYVPYREVRSFTCPNPACGATNVVR